MRIREKFNAAYARMKSNRVIEELDALRSRVAELEERESRLREALAYSMALIEVARLPNTEYVADSHNDAVRRLRAALRGNNETNNQKEP